MKARFLIFIGLSVFFVQGIDLWAEDLKEIPPPISPLSQKPLKSKKNQLLDDSRALNIDLNLRPLSESLIRFNPEMTQELPDDSGYDERTATSGTSATYSYEKARSQMGRMHHIGESEIMMPDKEMAPIFLYGLFNFYFAKFTGDIDEEKKQSLNGFNLNYLEVNELNARAGLGQASEEGLMVIFDFGITVKGNGLPEKWNNKKAINWFTTAADKLRGNSLLRKIGIHFQRQKIRVEKIAEQLQRENASERETSEEIATLKIILRVLTSNLQKAESIQKGDKIKVVIRKKEEEMDALYALKANLKEEKIKKNAELASFWKKENDQNTLQQMILRSWIERVARKLRLRYETNEKKGKISDPETDPFVQALDQIQPDFLSAPYWREGAKLLISCEL